MTALITINDIRARKTISLNTNEIAQLTPQILEAQDFDLRPILGDEFYFALVQDFEASPSLQIYGDLFNGSTYTFGGKEYTQEGIKAFLVYSVYARYTANSSVIATATGFVHKANQYSEHVSEKTVSRLVEQARSGSQVYADRFMLYLDRNRELYPLWKVNCKENKRYVAGVKIRQIG
jgi:hypothetical protein